MSKRLASSALGERDKGERASESGSAIGRAVARIVPAPAPAEPEPEPEVNDKPEHKVFYDPQQTVLMNIARMDPTGEVHARLMRTHKRYRLFMEENDGVEKKMPQIPEMTILPYQRQEVMRPRDGSDWRPRYTHFTHPHFVISKKAWDKYQASLPQPQTENEVARNVFRGLFQIVRDPKSGNYAVILETSDHPAMTARKRRVALQYIRQHIDPDHKGHLHHAEVLNPDGL